MNQDIHKLVERYEADRCINNGNIGWIDSRERTFKEVFPKQK